MEKQTLSQEVLDLLKKDVTGKYKGNDNNKNPKSDYLQKIVDMDDEKLSKECESLIWLSAYAANNWKSDYHFMCDACYDECQRRVKPEIYTIAHKRVSNSI